MESGAALFMAAKKGRDTFEIQVSRYLFNGVLSQSLFRDCRKGLWKDE